VREINQALWKVLPLLILFPLVLSCASSPHLKVHYQIPLASKSLEGRQVNLIMEDARADKAVLGEGAKEALTDFSGEFLLSVGQDKSQGSTVGQFNAVTLTREGMKRRLENMGLKIQPGQSGADRQMVIRINRFSLDLVDRNWIAKMNYEARLIKDGRFLSSQTINGQAERYKGAGKGKSERVMGELFTDILNKLDAVELFRRADAAGP
jgi:hypothetical protein